MVDMGELLASLARTFEFELKQHNTVVDIQSTMPVLYVEKSRMRQVFQNLIDNALKYMDREEGGRIEAGYELVDGFHRFWIADNGPGIAPEQQKKIFYVFRRAENTVGKVKGKGVGLALVKSVVANYQGRAWIDSRLGHGSRFYVDLAVPCTEPPAAPGNDAGGNSSNVECDYNPVGR